MVNQANEEMIEEAKRVEGEREVERGEGVARAQKAEEDLFQKNEEIVVLKFRNDKL